MRSYEYRHIVAFAETNFTGNVYFTSHLSWQGRCREMFVREHAPELLAELERDLVLATVRCNCEYFAELRPFDEIVVRMRLGEQSPGRLTLQFEYVKTDASGVAQLIARGEQQIASMRRGAGHELTPIPIPAALRAALLPYGGE
ncbi:MAG: acyl-CoA thioesterase [Planctomycetota bacterium]